MAIVIQQQPSFLESLLFGLGTGVEKGVHQFYKERDRKRGMTSQVLSKVLSGEISPELLATDLGQSFQRELGIDKEPALKQATQMGLEEAGYEESAYTMPGGARVTMPGVTPPEIPFELHRKKEEERKEVEAQTEQQRKLRFYTMQKRIDKIVEREFRKSLGERWEGAWSEYGRAIKMGVPVKGLVVRDPETGATMTMDTHVAQLGRQKAEKIAKTKSGITYLKEELRYNTLLMDAEKFVSKLSTAETMEPDEFESDFMKTEIGFWQQKELTPEQVRTRARRRLPIINAKILSQHKILRKQRFLAKDSDIILPFLKEFKLDEILNPERYAGEFDSIKAYTDLIKKSNQQALRDVATKEAKLRETLSMPETRHVVTFPELPKEPTEEAINAFAARIIDERWTDGDTSQPYTREKAREVAERLLKKK